MTETHKGLLSALRRFMNTRLAIEIKLLDDQIAEVSEQLVQQRKARLD